MPNSKKIVKILLADEEVSSRNALSSRLRMQGFEVEAATGGFHTLHLLEKHEYHVLIVNGQLHDMAGIEVCGLAKQTRKNSEIATIYMAKTKDPQEVEEGRKVELNEFMLKDSNFNSLLDKIKRHVKS